MELMTFTASTFVSTSLIGSAHTSTVNSQVIPATPCNFFDFMGIPSFFQSVQCLTGVFRHLYRSYTLSLNTTAKPPVHDASKSQHLPLRAHNHWAGLPTFLRFRSGF